MVEKIRFKREHLQGLDEFVFGISVKDKITDDQLDALEKRPHSYSIQKDGKILGCAGITMRWPQRGEAWVILKKDLKTDFYEITAGIRNFLDQVDIKRVEAVVDCDFVDGIRWMKTLGFKVEAPMMKAYGRDGKNCMLFARVKND